MFYRFVKRGFDLFNSALALVVLSPVFLIVCVGIKISSKGPVFYKSERIGQNGKPFTMLKFRSMHIKEKETKESQYLVNSSRIFKFGSFIRKSKLDELPQLINVLKADMSVVGPRPYPKSVVVRIYTGEYSKVLNVKPGLSCYDSLFDYAHGELFVTDEKKYAEEVLPIRTELAKVYVDKKSIGTDIYIILRTIGLIFDIIVRRKTEFKYDKTERETIAAFNKKQISEVLSSGSTRMV